MSDVAGARSRLRQERRRRRRARVALALAGLVALTLGVTALLVVTGGVAPRPAPRTLLLQVQGANGAPVVSAVLSDREDGAGLLLLPAGLELASGGLDALTRTPPQEYRDAVGERLGVDLDAGWVLDSATAQRLVDEVGPLPLEVDAPVDRGGRRVLEPGPQLLDGLSALAFATYRGPAEAERTRLVRSEQLLTELLAALPEDPEELLGGLGARSVVSVPLDELALLLERVGEAARDGELVSAPLPAAGEAAVVRQVLGQEALAGAD